MGIACQSVNFANPAISKYLSSKTYKITKQAQENQIFNRSILELLGADLPSTITEFVGRGWKSAVETFTRITMYFFNSFLIPVFFMPLLNNYSAKKHSVPVEFKNPFQIQYSDLLSVNKDDSQSIADFKNRLIEVEGEPTVSGFLGEEGEKHSKKLLDLKDTLLKAKGSVQKMDLFYDGMLTYLTPWIVTAISKKFLGVVGFVGEDNLLNESQKEESIQLHEKTKYLKFAAGAGITVAGGQWFANKVNETTNMSETEASSKKINSFIRKNIDHFDYHKGVYSNKLNLAGTLLFGGDAGLLLSCRSLNEIIEKTMRLAVFWPTLFFGLEWVNEKLCARDDKNHGTSLVEYDKPKDLGIRSVKSLSCLESDLIASSENKESEGQAFKNIKHQVKNFWKSIFIDSLVMGFGLTGANILGTKIRVEKFGIY